MIVDAPEAETPGAADDLEMLLARIRACRLCEAHLPMGPRPVLRATPSARILVIGQAPGIRVHESGIPWNDPSGDRLRRWLDLDRDTFYDRSRIAIVPMGFCYPGTGKSGDLPPRPECAATWHEPLRRLMPRIELTLLIGRFAIQHYLNPPKTRALGDIVRQSGECPDGVRATPHPSPRNIAWFKKNAWFETETVPTIRRAVHALL